MDLNDRRKAIEKALMSYKEMGSTRTETIIYKGKVESFPVVSLNIEVPYLNHANSRLRAQLINLPERSYIMAHPETSKSQDLLSELLKKTDKFNDLKNQLIELSQRQAGVISRDGLLVNGNTRLVALREAGEHYIDVAVLPSDATSEDFFQIEMYLQLTKLEHQDYTFTNELLLVQDLWQKEEQNEFSILQILGWKKSRLKDLHLDLRLLGLVEEFRNLKNPPIPYEFFDDKKELFKNIDSSMLAMSTDPLEAEKIKQFRFLAISLGLNKDETREINDEFIESEILDDNTTKFGKFINSFEENNNSKGPLDGFMLTDSKINLNITAAISEVLNLDEGSPKKEEMYRELRKKARDKREERFDIELGLEPSKCLDDVKEKIEILIESVPRLKENESFKGKGKLLLDCITQIEEMLMELKTKVETALD
jgi:hypothetical protein